MPHYNLFLIYKTEIVEDKLLRWAEVLRNSQRRSAFYFFLNKSGHSSILVYHE